MWQYGTFSLSLLPGNIASHYLLADHGTDNTTVSQ